MRFQYYFLLGPALTGLVLIGLSSPAVCQVYSGEGRAVLGSSMTPEDTKALAFEKARQAALQKFGAHVRSNQILQSATSPAGSVELTETRIAVLAAGDASVVEGTKETTRRPTEETVVYTTTAKFRIEPTDFEKTLEAYQDAGRRSELRQSVQTAVDVQSRLTRLDEDADPREVNKLLSKAEKTYDAVAAASRDFDGSGLEKRISRERQQQKNAAYRYLNVIRKHGFPGDIFETTIREPEVKDKGNKIAFEYRTRLEAENFRELTSTCREAEKVWGRKAHDITDWFPKLKKRVQLFLLDEEGRVMVIFDAINRRQRRGPAVQIEYEECDPERMFNHLGFRGVGAANNRMTWSFELSFTQAQSVDEVVLGFARDDFSRVARENGYTSFTPTSRYDEGWKFESEDGIPVESFLYTRKQFQKDIRSHAKEQN